MKKRFAFSTVSQVSYVLLGVFTMNEAALLGALLPAADELEAHDLVRVKTRDWSRSDTVTKA